VAVCSTVVHNGLTLLEVYIEPLLPTIHQVLEEYQFTYLTEWCWPCLPTAQTGCNRTVETT